MHKVAGNVTAVLESKGQTCEYNLEPGQSMEVETGNLAIMDSTCSREGRAVKGVKNMIFGGEGIFNTVVTGPGRVVLQTMPLTAFAGAIASVLPNKQ